MSRGEQLARQWQILRILENHRYGISIDELATRLERTRRTIERDLKALNDLGFPVESHAQEFGRKLWKLSPQFLESDKLILNPTEVISLYVANQLINPLAGSHLGDGWNQFFDRIQTVLPNTVLNYFSELEETLLVKPTQKPIAIPPSYLDNIRTALKESRKLDTVYSRDHNKSGHPTLLSPYGLILYENAFYVVGFSEESQGIRTYKLQRFKKIELTGQKFKKPEDFSLEDSYKGSFGVFDDSGKNRTTIRCEMKDWAALMIREQKWHRTQVIEKDNGETLIVSFLLDNTIEFMRWVLGFGPMARILEPEEVKTELIQSLKEALDKYQDNS